MQCVLREIGKVQELTTQCNSGSECGGNTENSMIPGKSFEDAV